MNDLKHTQIYVTSENDRITFYVRIVMLETKVFPHGLALATVFDDKVKAVEFAELVDEYIESCFLVCRAAAGIKFDLKHPCKI